MSKAPNHENRATSGQGAITTLIVDDSARWAEAAPRDSQKRLRDMLDGMGPSMFVALLTPQGILVEINRAPLVAGGLKAEDVLGKPFAETPWWSTPEVRQQLREAIARAARGEASRYDVRTHGADNQVIDLDFSLQPLRDESGEVVFLIPSASVITGRKHAETAMRESNVTFQQLADNITDVFWIRSPDFSELHYVSPAFERIWGRSVASLHANPKQWVDFILPEDRERVAAGFASLTDRAPSMEIEYRIVRPDGEIRWVRVRGFQVRNSDDQLVRHTGIVTDITAQMQAATELRTSLAEFRHLAESMPQIVWITTADGRNTYFSQQWMDYTGLTLEQSLGDGWNKPFHPDERQLAWEAWQRATTTAGIYAVESRLRRADGVYRWWLVRGVPQRDAAGRILKWFGTCTDIHDMKLAALEIADANRTLQQQQTELRVVIDLMPAVITFKDTENIFRRVNQRFAQSVGKPVAQLEGKSTTEIFLREAAAYDADDLKVINSGKPELGRVKSSRDRQGNEVWQQVDKVPVCESDGRVIGLLVVAQDITERRRTEEALQVSQKHLRLLVDLTDAMRPLVNPAQIMVLATRMLGEYLGVSCCACAHMDQDHEGFRIVHDYTDGGASTVGHYQLSHFGAQGAALLQSGKTLVIRDVAAELLLEGGADAFTAIGIKAIIACPLIKHDGLHAILSVHQASPRDWKPAEIALVHEVVTRCWATIERLIAEEKLRKSEAMLRITAWTARLGGWNIELPEFRILWSEELCAILEVPPGTAPTLEQAVSFYAPESQEPVRQAIAACAEQGAPFDLELEIITAKGNRIGVRVTGEAERNAAGVITHLQGAFQDITERKKIADELRASEKRFRALFDQAAVGFALTDATTGRIVQINQRLCEILGRSREELAQLTFAALTHPQDLPLSLDIARQIIAGPLRASTEEKRYLRKDQSEVWATVTVSAMWAAGEEPDYFIVVAQDVTGRKKLEGQLRQAQKMDAIGTLAGGIAHDFNNILAAINGYTELSTMQLTGNSEVRGYLGAVLQASSRATDLVRQILTFSRQQKVERRPIQLQPVVTEALKLLRASIPSTIQFEISIKDAPVVLADATQVHQVIMNLGTNAWHAMKDRPGRFQVKLEHSVLDASHGSPQARLNPGDYARLSVSDSGGGMDEGMVKRIFEPFFTTKPIGEGTGLGLAVVHGIMAAHDGAVTVYSEPGEGTVFHLYFPAFSGATPVVKPGEGPIPLGHGEEVLFVDDEELLIQLGRKTLSSLGYTVEVAQDPVAALELVRAHPSRFALVVTDQTMPHMTGLLLASELQRIRPGLPIILMTGYGLALTPDRVAAAGIHQLLIKPTNIHALATAVHAALSVPKIR